MLVNLLDFNKNPLGLIHPALGRKLLKSNKAKPVFKLCIPKKVFVIRLLDDIYLEEIKEYLKTPELTLGIDPGASKAGFSVVSKEGEVLYASQVEVRNDITTKMKRRSTYRRNRRQRKTRYRQPRFLNRASSKKEGRLPPTVKSKLDSHIKEINYIRSIFNIKTIVIEEAKFDTHVISEGRKLRNLEYQKGKMYKFENVKAYVRERDGYKCNICKSKGYGNSSNSKRLEVHHILERSNGGTNSPDNLITLCSDCHKKVHSKEITLNKKRLKSKTRSATQVDTIISQLKKYLDNTNINISYTNGVRTSLIRRKLKLIKRHHCDAVSIALKYRKRYKKITKIKKSCKVVYKKCVSKGDYQLYKGKRSEKKIPVGKIHGFRKFDKVKYLGDNKNKCYFIKGRMTSGYFVLMDINGESIKLKPMAKPSTVLRIKSRGSLLVV